MRSEHDTPPAARTLTIIMPVYDERATVAAAIEDALTAELPVDGRQLVVVDDGSRDGTRELLRDGSWPDGVKVVFHDRNRGQGRRDPDGARSMRAASSRRSSTPISSMRPPTSPTARAALSGRATVVYGTRAWTSQSSFSFWYVMGNKAVTFATNVLYNCWISDVMTCHKAMRTDLFRSLPLRERGFAIEPEIAARVLQKGVRIFEVPIGYHARGRDEGKKLTAVDGLRVLRTLIRCQALLTGDLTSRPCE